MNGKVPGMGSRVMEHATRLCQCSVLKAPEVFVIEGFWVWPNLQSAFRANGPKKQWPGVVHGVELITTTAGAGEDDYGQGLHVLDSLSWERKRCSASKRS